MRVKKLRKPFRSIYTFEREEDEDHPVDILSVSSRAGTETGNSIIGPDYHLGQKGTSLEP